MNNKNNEHSQIREIQNPKNNVENIGTRQRFSVGNPRFTLLNILHAQKNAISFKNMREMKNRRTNVENIGMCQRFSVGILEFTVCSFRNV